MPNIALSKTDFDREVHQLLRLKEHVAATLRPAVEAILKFSNAYRTLHQRIGPNYDRRVALRTRLGLDEYQHQRLMAIAAQSKTLTQFQRALPPAVEPLYEIARLTKDAAGEKRLRAAINRHELTPTSGIREIRSIRQSTRRRTSKPPATKRTERAATLEFVIEGDKGLTPEIIEQFQVELVTLVEKYGLHIRTSDGAKRHRTKQPESNDRHADFAELSAEPRAELERELLECCERHRAAWKIDNVPDMDGERMHALSHEILQIAAKHGVPRAIASLNLEMSPEVRKTYAIVKPIVERDRAERDKQEHGSGQPKRQRRSPREDIEPT